MHAESFVRPVVLAVLCLWVAGGIPAGELPEPKPVPRLQIVPMPYDQASFQRDGVEITRYHFGPGLHRPFLFPVIGPAGRSLTRMGHPHNPESHSHHNSVWISHHDVGGVDFWGDRGGGAIRHRRIVKYEDEGETSFLVAENEWVDTEGKVLLNETRTVRVTLLPDKEWLLAIDLKLSAADEPVTLGKTPFGMIGIRVAKPLGVRDGGGCIRNCEGAVNEKAIFWKRARWVDYSGAIEDSVLEGVTLLDHPGNPNHPSHFHVRNDGWMGASLTFEAPREIQPAAPLHLRYGLYVHNKIKQTRDIDKQWNRFAQMPAP